MASSSEFQPAIGSSVVVQFGPFELDRSAGKLRKQGTRIRLQPKPMQILCALVERPGRIVTRDELKARLWPDDTFVDFKSGLNTAVNRLRIVLGDSAEQPRYIETEARNGYRFIAPTQSKQETAVRVIALSTPPEPPRERRYLVRWCAVAALGLLAIGVVAGVRLRLPSPPLAFRQ